MPKKDIPRKPASHKASGLQDSKASSMLPVSLHGTGKWWSLLLDFGEGQLIPSSVSVSKRSIPAIRGSAVLTFLYLGQGTSEHLDLPLWPVILTWTRCRNHSILTM